jgi:hypothetical protein
MKQQALSQLANGFDLADIDLCGALQQHRRNREEETVHNRQASFSVGCF